MRSMRLVISPRLSSLCSMVFLGQLPLPARGERVGMRGKTKPTTSERRQPRRRRRVLDRHGEADADEHRLPGGIEYPGDDADHFAVDGDERSARASRIPRGVELDQVRQEALAFGRLILAPQA